MLVKDFSQNKKGFTLIELMVSVSIFIIIVTTIISSLLIINKAVKKTEAIRTLSNSLSFALENITRNLRLGDGYTCASGTTGPNTGCTAISFNTYKNNIDSRTTRVYGYNATTGNILRCADADLTKTSTCQALTSPGLTVTDMRFVIKDTAINPNHPGVFVSIKGQINVQGEVLPFAIETFVSQRQFAS